LLAVISALIKLVESFGQQKVLLLGDFALDRHVGGDTGRISPEAPVPVLAVAESNEGTGNAATVAMMLAALGAEVECFGVLGDDDAGSRLTALLERLGCRTAGLIPQAGRSTTARTRLVGRAPHQHRQQLTQTEPGGSEAPARESVRLVLEGVSGAVGKADLVCVRDDERVGCELVHGAINAARQASKPVLVDATTTASCEPYRGASLLITTRLQIESLVGQQPDGSDDLAEQAKAVLKQYDLSGLAVTLDREGGILVLPGGSSMHVTTKERDVRDITGAGEAALAMLAAALAASATAEQAVELANITGGLEAERVGFAPISREEVLSELLARRQRPAPKLRDLDELLVEVKALRRQKRRIVFTNGCFDVLHPGHIEYFDFCRRQGDVVVVGLDSDQSVRCNNKGADRPIFKQLERARMLSGLQAIDFIAFFDDADPTGLIRAVRPDVLVKGAHWGLEGVVGRDIVEAYGGEVVLAPIVEGYSTTSIIERVRRADPAAVQDESKPGSTASSRQIV
jgi:D-beta-D-heptose 7-phosphate kinase/D-beta-D-heptose 1-phosphate adenosyltransferase